VLELGLVVVVVLLDRVVDGLLEREPEAEPDDRDPDDRDPDDRPKEPPLDRPPLRRAIALSRPNATGCGVGGSNDTTFTMTVMKVNANNGRKTFIEQLEDV
jgi:hypothetical protein